MFHSSGKAIIIAEIGLNHNGCIDIALDSIQSAAQSGADIVKFQTFNTDSFLSKDSFDLEERKEYELTLDEWQKCKKCAKDNNVEFISTPLDNQSVDVLDNMNVPFIKIASCDLTNFQLLEKVVSLHKPILISTGYSQVEEILKTVSYLQEQSVPQIGIMHCVASYPTSTEDANLINISLYKKLFPEITIGLSDHSKDISIIPCAAIALGAAIIEKHFTLDNSLDGYDHQMSLNPSDFKRMVSNIRETELSLGFNRLKTGRIASEKKRFVNARRSLYWASDKKPGDIVTKDDLIALRPGGGIPAERYFEIIGKTVIQNVRKLSALKSSNLDSP